MKARPSIFFRIAPLVAVLAVAVACTIAPAARWFGGGVFAGLRESGRGATTGRGRARTRSVRSRVTASAASTRSESGRSGEYVATRYLRPSGVGNQPPKLTSSPAKQRSRFGLYVSSNGSLPARSPIRIPTISSAGIPHRRANTGLTRRYV